MQAVAVNNFEVIKWKHPKDDDYCVLNQYRSYHVCLFIIIFLTKFIVIVVSFQKHVSGKKRATTVEHTI